MAYGTPTDPTPGSVITAAYAVANFLNPIRALRAFTGGADPPGSNYWLRSTSTSAVSWVDRATEVLAAIGSTLTLPTAVGDKIKLYSTNAGVAIQTGKAILYGNGGLVWGVADDSSGTNWAKIWYAGNDGVGSGLDADLFEGLHGSGYALVSRQVPLGAVVWFETLAELTAAGASWARDTAADGRLLVGAGSSASSQTFVEATNYGADWTPAAALGVNSGNLDVAGSTDGTNPANAAGTGAPTSTLGFAAAHSHTLVGASISGAPALTNTSSVWVPYMRAGIWGRHI